ncbi:MAG: head-tail connector protein [Geminicoccaceae bacterium]|nr:head-tail connector protein [Geminicoccaceae bacterium]
MAEDQLQPVRRAYALARDRRAPWESIWSECFAHAQPSRAHGLASGRAAIGDQTRDLYDGTAVDGVEQLAASLLAELTPPWSRWFGLAPGDDVDPLDRERLADLLDTAARRIQGHLDRSNFAVEMHQCLLDLVTVGTATLSFEEAPMGEASAFRFTAVPTSEMFVDGDANGGVRNQFRATTIALAALARRFPEACDWRRVERAAGDARTTNLRLVEAVLGDPDAKRYVAFVDELPGISGPLELARGTFEGSPFITFRWLKGAGELYGRSPMMSALPDVRTANKVVELILKNASLAVTGIWLAEDDGVLNPSNIRLAPGSIIPKAAGSSGLTPLQSPGRLDVSQLVLDDLRANIRRTLLTDRLGPIAGPRMTATEVLERSAETARLLGAIYGRLQAELLTPLLRRAVALLARRGDIPPFSVDGSTVELQYRSPLARAQAREEVRNVALWLETVTGLAKSDVGAIDVPATVRWLAEQLGVPRTLVATHSDVPEQVLMQALAGDGT